MATAARDRLGRELRGEAKSAFSTELTARVDGLSLDIEGFGRLRLPVTPAKARKLIALGEPARFGRGEETLTDREVRDTWEIPRALVRAEWDDAVLTDVLTTVKDELGIPNAATLTAELHSLLVYEPDQFFLLHQDSEKSDDMMGTLVVTLPSTYTGGELQVWHNDELKTYQSSWGVLSLVAFYADCHHEVLKVKSGYRVTLTYNLLLHGDTERPAGDEGVIAEVASLLREHFSTPAPGYYGEPANDPPRRLAYLLDHEYTPRALHWSKLKGNDASRAALLRSAADRAGCELVLALADIRETHGAHETLDGFGRRRRGWHDSYDGFTDAEGEGEGEYEIQDLINSDFVLTHWTAQDGTGLEETSLRLGQAEVCASTPSGDLEPYSQEFEGYMGNWGNTLDRWYHRAAVVIWPLEQAFANRAETSPAWALDELSEVASSGELADARAKVATLGPFWDAAVRARGGQDRGDAFGLFSGALFSSALRAAWAVADAPHAAMLLHPFIVENLTDEDARSFAEIAERYGEQWMADLLPGWFEPGRPAWESAGGRKAPDWTADRLPRLCQRLRTTGSAGLTTALRLLDLAWERIRQDIRSALATSQSGRGDSRLTDLGRQLAGVLAAAAAIGADDAQDAVVRFVRQQADAVTALELAALRVAVARRSARTFRDAGLEALAGDCAARLASRLARPEREAGDWSIDLPAGGCACALCSTLRGFLADKHQRILEWPLANDGRQHVHARIDLAELPVTHETRRQGRPYALVLEKADALFTREQDARASDEAQLAWLSARRARDSAV